MKTQAMLILSLATAMSCTTAHAWVRPGWDRPMYRANLTVLDQEGQAPKIVENAKEVELVMTQQDGSSSPTGFVLLIDGEFKQAYTVKSVTKDSCNSTTYALVPVQEQGNYRLDVSETIQFVDHSDRTCLDYRKFRWEMNVNSVTLTHEVVGQVRMAGNPESVITPQ